MAAKKKPIYKVWVCTEYGAGIQAVKANDQEEARSKHEKRFPKKEIIDIDEEPMTEEEMKAHRTLLRYAI